MAQFQRRKLLAAALLAWPWLALAKTSKVYRLGYLDPTDEASAARNLEAFLIGMRELGYVTGSNLVVDVRAAKGNVSHYPPLIDELIALRPDVLLGNGDACRAMAKKTSRIPIVLIASLDPVAQGLVKSLAKPGTNVTGMSSLYGPLIAKHIELLTEIVPKMSRIALLNDRSFSGRALYSQVAQEAARAKGLELAVIEADPSPNAIQAAFVEIQERRSQAVTIGGTGPFFFARRTITDEALRLRLPSIYNLARFVEDGGLISYGENFRESLRTQVPRIVDRILRGANPAEIPVQQAAKFELAVNVKTARALGIAIPPSILVRADRVIE